MSGSDLDRRLASLDRGQLVALVHRLLSRHPDLEDLVLLPLPGETLRADAHHIRSQVTRILLAMGDDWQASIRARRDLWPLLAVGRQYLQRSALGDARTLFATIATTILEHYEQIHDEESELAGIVNDCVDGLGVCLEGAETESEREVVLGEIFSIYRWDALESGGYGMDAAARDILLAKVTQEERRLLARWTHDALGRITGESAQWRRQNGGRFVLELLGSELGEAERERLYTDARLDRSLMSLLLSQERMSEALELLSGCASGDLAWMAEQLMEVGKPTEALEVVSHHPAVLEQGNHVLDRWMEERGVALPDKLDALRWEIWRFERKPSITGFEKLRHKAREAGCWPAVLAHISDLRTDLKGLTPIRARVQAELGNVEHALAELEALDGSSWRSAATAVAHSLEPQAPTIAADLYRRLLAQLPSRRTKAARAKAANYQERLRALEGADG